MRYINVLLIIGFVFLATLYSCDKKTQNDKMPIVFVKNSDLSLKDYISFNNYMPVDGLVPNEEMAVQIAEIVLSNLYGHERIEQQKPFSINLENNIWIIEGYWDRNDFSTDGGVAYMEISKNNGAILKVIHTK